MTDKPTITQADRDAAYNFNLYETAASILGDGEIRRLASYFAKHRESSVAELQSEVERLREALLVLQDLPIKEKKGPNTIHLGGVAYQGAVVEWTFNIVRNIKEIANAALSQKEPVE